VSDIVMPSTFLRLTDSPTQQVLGEAKAQPATNPDQENRSFGQHLELPSFFRAK
jgi:hypothetical protein